MGIIKGIISLLVIAIIIFALWFIFDKSFWISLIAITLGIGFVIWLVKGLWDL